MVCVEAERERDPKIRVREERASGSFFSRVEILIPEKVRKNLYLYQKFETKMEH